jgi:ATP-dependent helicase/nuclease subunit A
MTPDQHIRQRAITGLDVSMALSAGAGSGKTSVLTERIIETLLSGTLPSSLAAITFTEKAAGELVVRVRDALERRLHGAEQTGDTTVVARIGAVLTAFPTLTITTIHSFCSELLAREAFAADVAPGVEVGVDDALQRQMHERIGAFLRGLRRETPLVWWILQSLSSEAQLVQAALALESWVHYDDGTGGLSFDVAAARTALTQVREDITAAVGRCRAADADKRIANNLALIDHVDAALMHDDGLAALLGGSGKPSRKGGRKGDWDDGGMAAFDAALEAVVQWRSAWRGAAWAEVVRRLRRDVIHTFVEHKREAGQCSFQDLLTLTSTLLSTQPAARDRLAARFTAILVDEVQDTDPTQAEIALSLTQASGGLIFAVGDPRQSIYRFRGADAETFARLERQIAENGERHALITNFRSVPGLVAWVNHTFGALPGYVPQQAARCASESRLDPVVFIDGVVGDDDDDDDDDDDADVGRSGAAGSDVAVGSDSVTGAEGADEDSEHDADSAVCADELMAGIAWLEQLLSSGATVMQQGAPRPLSARDVMILLPSWGRADAIADALRARGIAAVVEGGGAFFQRDEVRLLVDALRVLVEPGDGEATATVLRGLFGVSFVEMATHVKAGGALRCTLPSPAPGVVADALGVLAALHRRVGFVSLSGLLDELLAHTRAQAVHVLCRDGEARSANVDKLLSIVRELEREATGPHAVLDGLLQQALSRAGDKDVDRLDDDSDAVRVTTLFKAKGLEAPVVLLLHATRNLVAPATIVDHAARRVVVSLGKLRPPSWDDAIAAETRALAEERRRWIYVAATRARDQLVLCRTGRESRRKALLDADVVARGLPADAKAAGRSWHPADTPGATVRLVSMASLSQSTSSWVSPSRAATFVSSSPGAIDAVVDAALAVPPAGGGDPEGDGFVRRAREQTRAAARGCVRWRSPSRDKATLPGANTASAPAGVADVVTVEDPAVAVGARVGKVVHEVMERVDLHADEASQRAQVDVIAPLLARRAGLGDDQAAVVGLIAGRIVAHPAMALARSAPEHWREVPFSHPVGRRGVVTGVIDLCFPVDESRRRWVIFDWKSKLPPEGTPLRLHYEQQLAAYGRALLKAFGDVEIAQTVLVGPHRELGPPRTIDDVLAELGEALPQADRDGLLALMPKLEGQGIALPLCDVELDEDVPSQAALCFFAEKVAVAVDTAEPVVFGIGGDAAEVHRARLVEKGWRVCDTVAEAAALLGLPLEDAIDDIADRDDAGGDGASEDMTTSMS